MRQSASFQHDRVIFIGYAYIYVHLFPFRILEGNLAFYDTTKKKS